MREIRSDLVRVELSERLPRRLFHTRGLVLHADCLCIVEHGGTLEMGRVIGTGDDLVGEGLDVDPREVVVREATSADLEQHRQTQAMEDRVRRFCQDRVRERKLDMKVSGAVYSFDRTKLRVYFTSENRVDFRELVRDLAAAFKARIEMRQVGVRDEARMVGGVGICGLELCCSKWLVQLVPITIKMAKEQNLALNPQNISGMCGRLLCCLSYEYETYRGQRRRFPRIGARVIVNGTEGVVKDVNLLTQKMSVDFSGRMETVTLSEVVIDKPELPQRPAGEGQSKRRRKRRKSAEEHRPSPPPETPPPSDL